MLPAPRFHTARIEHALEELSRGGLSVRARDADDWALAPLVGELEFADHFDAAAQEILDEAARPDRCRG
jgi:hypothetical protein